MIVDGRLVIAAVIQKLVMVVRHITFDNKSHKSLVAQTELLHGLVVWTRNNKVSIYDV